MLILVTLCWLVCAFLNWGLYNGSHRNACYSWLNPHTYRNLLLGLWLGPVATLATLLTYGCYWSLKPMSKEESWGEWKRKGYGDDSPQSREEFERYYEL